MRNKSSAFIYSKCLNHIIGQISSNNIRIPLYGNVALERKQVVKRVMGTGHDGLASQPEEKK